MENILELIMGTRRRTVDIIPIYREALRLNKEAEMLRQKEIFPIFRSKKLEAEGLFQKPSLNK